jgi:rhodanese-related sulfurtransferase
MTVVSAKEARKYFEAKLNFTTGPVELNRMIDEGEDIKIIDVRARQDYAKGHIPGAVSLPKGAWGTFLGLSEDKVNVVYCYSEVCHLAASAARFFADNDYPVMELQGGFDQWTHHNLPVET